MANRGKKPIPKTQREILNSQIEPFNPPPDRDWETINE